MDTSKYLPIGSIVTIERYDKEVMIIGYMAYTEKDKNEIISGDYVGIPVEEGYREDNRILFNKENITNVIFMGYKIQNTVNILNSLDKSLEFLKRSKADDDIIKELFANSINVETNSKIVRVSESKIKEENKNE